MPSYPTPRHGVSQTEAFLEAAAIAPAARAMLSTLELRHVDLPLPVRIVNDQVNLTAFLEDAAPLNGGEEVEFIAIRYDLEDPEESDQAAAPTINIVVNNVSGQMYKALRMVRGSLIPWELTERVYASDDLSGPARLPPVTMLLSSVEVSGRTIVLRANFGDPGNVAVPAITFKRSEYPGLAAR